MLKAPGMCWTDPCGCCPMPSCVLSKSLQMMHRFRVTFTWSLRGFTCWFITAACHGSSGHVSCVPLRLTVVTWPGDCDAVSHYYNSQVCSVHYMMVSNSFEQITLPSAVNPRLRALLFLCVCLRLHARVEGGVHMQLSFSIYQESGPRCVWWLSWFAKYYCHCHSRKESNWVDIMVWATCAAQHIGSFTCRCGRS